MKTDRPPARRSVLPRGHPDQFDLDRHVYDALLAGAPGFLLKDVSAEQLVNAITA